MGNPKVALAAVVHSIGMNVMYNDPFAKSVDFKIGYFNYGPEFRKESGSTALAAVDKAGAEWKKTLPAKNDFWQWCLDADQKTLLSLLAYFTAKSDNYTDQLPAVLGLDMTKWFTPTAKNFFGRLRKPDIIAAIKDATGRPVAPATEKLKNAELAAFAERTLKNTGWLPKLLRAPETKPANKPQKKAA